MGFNVVEEVGERSKLVQEHHSLNQQTSFFVRLSSRMCCICGVVGQSQERESTTMADATFCALVQVRFVLCLRSVSLPVPMFRMSHHNFLGLFLWFVYQPRRRMFVYPLVVSTQWFMLFDMQRTSMLCLMCVKFQMYPLLLQWRNVTLLSHLTAR